MDNLSLQKSDAVFGINLKTRRWSFFIKIFATVLIIIIISCTVCSAQGTATGTGYQMMLMNNPAFSGSDGTGSLRLSYMNYYPGNSYNLHSVYLSYDSYFSMLNGGAGFFISDDYLGGIVNDLRAGLSYSYFLRAGADLYINAGLSGSVMHRGYNFDNAVLPDQIDPIGGVSRPSGETLSAQGHTLFDMGAGFLFIWRRFFGGFSVTHLTEPSLSETNLPEDKLKRTLFINVTGDFGHTGSKSIRLRPQAFSEMREGYFYAAAGAVMEITGFSVNAFLIRDDGNNLNVQSGFSLGRGNVSIFYNYIFNVASGNNLMPFSLLHQTGLEYSLNRVEKRNKFKTINFPK